MGSEGEMVARLIPEFEQQHPGIRVRVQSIPWSAAHEKLLTAYVGEAMPDVFQSGNTWLPELAALGALEPLDNYLRQARTIEPDDYFAGIWETSVIDGTLYGVPWYVDTRVMFYRADLLRSAGFEQSPRSWEEWSRALHAIKAAAGPGRYAMLVPLREWQVPVIFALQRDAELLRDGDRYGNFRSEPFRQAFDFYLGLFRHGLAAAGGETQVANLYQDFADGFFSYYITGPWNLGEFSRRLPAALQDDWATAPMPSLSGDAIGVSLAGGASLALSSRSPRKAAAWKLIEYLCTARMQLELYRLTGDLPARRIVWDDELLAGNRRVAAFRAQLQRVRSTPRIPEWEQIAHKITEYAEAAVRQTMSADEALAGLDADVDRILEKRRWLLEERGHRRILE
jgi:multiple sugar transport system substrate-binding protein